MSDFNLAAMRARQQQMDLDLHDYPPITRKMLQRCLSETQADLTAACAEVERLKDWQATVTVALGREGGVFFEDVAAHIRELRAQLAAWQHGESLLA